jgi:broad specificity phosphatase PhoE
VLIVCRHGRTAANASGLLLGRADPPLDEVGRTQARALAAVVAGATRVVSSPLRRAVETAHAFGLPLTVDERWIELDYGGLDERPVTDVPADLWQRWRAEPGFVPAEGESLVALGGRVRDACDELAEEARTADVAVVSHVSPIKAAVAWALGVGDEVAWRLWVAPASVARIGVGDHGPSLRGFNDVGHLAGDPVR